MVRCSRPGARVQSGSWTWRARRGCGRCVRRTRRRDRATSRPVPPPSRRRPSCCGAVGRHQSDRESPPTLHRYLVAACDNRPHRHSAAVRAVYDRPCWNCRTRTRHKKLQRTDSNRCETTSDHRSANTDDGRQVIM